MKRDMVLAWLGSACLGPAWLGPVCVVLVVGGLCGGASAQIDPPSGDPVGGHGAPLAHSRVVALIDQLASSDWAVRQRAEQFLLITPSGELPFIEARLGDADMSPEQRVRLSRVGAKVFRRLPHAAMGISFVSGMGNDVPEIREPLRAFDASRVLMPGDVVTRIDGRAVGTVAVLRAAIISHEPGDQVEVEVRRGERVVAVSFALGAYADLQNRRLDEGDLDAAWAWRIARSSAAAGNVRAHEEPGPIVPPIEVAGDLPVVRAQTDFSSTIYQFGAAVAVAAGQPLAMAPPSPYRPSAMNNGARRPAQPMGTGEERNRDRITAIEGQIAENRRAIGLLEQRIATIEMSLEMPHPEADRKRLGDLRASAAGEITRLTLDSARLSRFLDALRK